MPIFQLSYKLLLTHTSLETPHNLLPIPCASSILCLFLHLSNLRCHNWPHSNLHLASLFLLPCLNKWFNRWVYDFPWGGKLLATLIAISDRSVELFFNVFFAKNRSQQKSGLTTRRVFSSLNKSNCTVIPALYSLTDFNAGHLSQLKNWSHRCKFIYFIYSLKNHHSL